jgi:Na+/H+-translocating membrane pyrophosphatase
MDIEQIKKSISEQKHNTIIFNNAGVEWENLKALLNYILNNTNKELEEFKRASVLADTLCDDLKNSLEQIKLILPKE